MINRLAIWIGTIIQRAVFWMVFNVPLGRLAPILLGWALGAKPVRIDNDGDAPECERRTTHDN